MSEYLVLVEQHSYFILAILLQCLADYASIKGNVSVHEETGIYFLLFYNLQGDNL
ncbi:MAG: hypothetical protein KPI85_05520 [cyanobacterium endosymbiont of Epithemia adnata isolate EadnSB Bon19]